MMIANDLSAKRQTSTRLLVLAFCAATPLLAQVAPERTVIDNEYGQYYGYGPAAASVGSAVLSAHNPYFSGMQPEAIKAPHGHFQHFAPADPGDDFPYAELKAFEASEIAAGRPPIFVTASYGGKKRPVYFEWHLALSGTRPTASPQLWSQAVNLRDDRFIQFFVNVYLRKTLWQPSYQNYWHATDNCAFRYDDYGVLDDSGQYVPNVTWDAPFAQSDSDFLDSVKYFLRRLKEMAPDVRIIGNEGSMANEARFADVWSGFDASIREEINGYFAGDAYSRNQLFTVFNRFRYMGPAGKASLLRSLLPAEQDPSFGPRLRTGLMTYLIFRGPNFFWGPRFDDGTVAGVPPDRYASTRDTLGLPTADPQSQSATNDGYRLYWRTCEGGIVYLNWTGQAQTVTLPTDKQYFDRNGAVVKTLVIPDLAGDYVTTQVGTRAQRPTINPRRQNQTAGPIAVTLATETPSTIHFTTDGTDPSSSSPVYSGPILVDRSLVVKAKAFCPTCLNSFTSQATYQIAASLPTVNFYSPAGSGTSFVSANYPLVALSYPSASPVTVAYRITSGGSGNGTITFRPGETYQTFPITVSSAVANQTIQVLLSQPVGAVLGSISGYTYTVGSGTGITQPPAPVRTLGAPSGNLPSTTTSVNLSLTTDVPSTCRYSLASGVSYTAMGAFFPGAASTTHSAAVSGLTPGTSYTYFVKCQTTSGTANVDDYPISFFVAAALPPPVVGPTPGLRVHVGGSAYTDLNGNVWAADNSYFGGSVRTSAGLVAGTTSPVLYQSQRSDMNGYDFALANGTYAVRLLFAELVFTTPNQRKFDVALNYATVLTDFDIVSAAGGAYRAVDRTFQIVVNNGELFIGFNATLNSPVINGIEITKIK
jgi:hypothetical protein